MKTKLLQFFDKYLGALLVRLWPCLSTETNDINAQTPLLFIQLAEIGTHLIAKSKMNLRMTQEQQYLLTLASNKGFYSTARLYHQNHIFYLRHYSPIWLLYDLYQLKKWVKIQNIQAVVDLELFSNFSSFICLFLGLPAIGFSKPGDDKRTKPYFFSSLFDSKKHVADNYERLISAIPFANTSQKPVLNAHPHLLSVEELKLRQLIADNSYILFITDVGPHLPQRNWPIDYHIQSVEQLLKKTSKSITVITRHPTLFSAFTQQYPNLIILNKIDDFIFLSLIKNANQVICSDSGPAHMASWLETKSIVLFGPESPSLFAPINNSISLHSKTKCSPCLNVYETRSTKCKNNICMKNLSPEDVVEKVINS